MKLHNILGAAFWTIVFFWLFASVAHSSGWLIHHVGSFRGKVIDAETKEPIEGAAVVAQYHVLLLTPLGSRSHPIDVQEAVTNKDGEFLMPPFTKGINPLSIGDGTRFLIWKPGYNKERLWGDDFFTKEPGTVEERNVQTKEGFVTKPVRLGIVELTRTKSMEERRVAKPSPLGEIEDWKKQKQLIKMIREEWKSIYSKDPKGLYGYEEDGEK